MSRYYRLYEAVGKRIREERTSRGMSLSDVARKLIGPDGGGVSRTVVADVEGGRAIPFWMAVSLADLWDITLDDLAPVDWESQ